MSWESNCSGSAPRNGNVANAAPGVSNLPKAEVVERCSQAGLFRVEAVTLDLRAPTRLDSLVLMHFFVTFLRHHTVCEQERNATCS